MNVPGGRPPARLWWVAAGSGGLALVAGVVLFSVLAFLVVGVSSGPVDWGELLTSSVWDPASGRFGAAAMVFGSAVVAVVALALAAPIGWAAALAVNELAPARWRRALRSGAELLAVVPSIVYGLLGIAFLRPLVSRLADVPGGDSLLAAALVLAVMVLPTIVAVSVDALASVPDSSREAAFACGLKPTEVITSAVLPQARRGMAAAALLGLARALGETIAVFLVVGRADGRMLHGLGDLWQRLVRPGQTLTTKLNGPESVLAGTSGAHWAALCALGLVLLGSVVLLTLLGLRRSASPGARGGSPVPKSRWAGRTARDRSSRVLLGASLAVPLALVVAIAAVVASRGRAAFDPGFWWSPSLGASGGGVRDQLLGTCVLVGAAGLLAAPVGLGLGLVTGEYARPRAGRILRSLTLTLGGV
ncbi:MAG: ABC transporter permease subunit, partial [Acidimicrobiales bacterium]